MKISSKQAWSQHLISFYLEEESYTPSYLEQELYMAINIPAEKSVVERLIIVLRTFIWIHLCEMDLLLIQGYFPTWEELVFCMNWNVYNFVCYLYLYELLNYCHCYWAYTS